MKLSFAIVLAMVFSQVFPQKAYVEVTSVTDIRLEPRGSSGLVAWAEHGNIFEFVHEKRGWFAVYMFSGEYRYIRRSDCQKRNDFVPDLTLSEEQKKIVFNALRNAEDKAQEDTDLIYHPSEVMKNIAHYRMLLDKYDLDVMNRYGLPAPTYRKLVWQGVTQGW